MTRLVEIFQRCTAAGFLLLSAAALAEPRQIMLEVVNAVATRNISGSPAIDLALTAESGRAFADFTTEHVGQIIEVRLQDQVLMRATLQTSITGGKLQVAGGVTMTMSRN
jgi:preprotein translocase subunit SecD